MTAAGRYHKSVGRATLGGQRTGASVRSDSAGWVMLQEHLSATRDAVHHKARLEQAGDAEYGSVV